LGGLWHHASVNLEKPRALHWGAAKALRQEEAVEKSAG
jgi:hypothetical protein